MPRVSHDTAAAAQPTLWDQPHGRTRAARARRRDGMARADDHADSRWKIDAWTWLVAYLRSHPTFFADDVWPAGCPRPAEARAFGPLVLRAAREGLIRKTGTFRPRTSGNLTPAPVWESLVYDPTVAS